MRLVRTVFCSIAFALVPAAALAAQGPPNIAAPPARIPDPSVDVDFPCYAASFHLVVPAHGGEPVAGLVYWPTSCTSTLPPAVLPLVVLVHGDGHAYDEYDSTCVHLARNGFIVASIDGGEEVPNVFRATRVLPWLDFLRFQWVHAPFVQNNIALAGHSRGGEGVLTAARKLVEWGLDHDVNAVVAIAPTDNDNGGSEGLESLVRSSAESLLVIYGSRDEDVKGYCTFGSFDICGSTPIQPARTGFTLYDRAGGEGSTDDLPQYDDVVTKCMVFIDGADHGAFRDIPCPGMPPGGHITCAAQRNVSRGYITAFLKWQLRGLTAFRPFCTGRLKPKSVADDGTHLRIQFSNGLQRRVVDNAEQPGWSVATLGTVTKDGVSVLREGPVFDHGNFTIPHETSALVVSWERANKFVLAPWMRWSIPDDVTPNLGKRVRDIRDFDVLSLRIGQVYDAPSNTPGEAQRFSVRLLDAWGNSSPSLPGPALRYPDQGYVVDIHGGFGDCPKSSMQTARFDLDAFTGVDLEHVTAIELRFDHPERLKGEVVLDSLELSD